MTTMSRRDAMGLLAGLAVFLSSIPGCCTLKQLFHIACDEKDAWKQKARDLWATKRKLRDEQRARERGEGKRPDVKTPYPYLQVDIAQSSHGTLADQFRNIPLNEWREVHFLVRNGGNGASYSCHVEMYESPWANYELPYASFRLVSRKVITVLPGHTVEVVMPWQTTRQTDGGLALRCYDPVLDPGLLVFKQRYRQDSGFSWSRWPGG